MLAGREFTRGDALRAPTVAIVNQAFARKFKLGPDPVGRHMDQGNKKYDLLIVGLAKDAKYRQVKDLKTMPQQIRENVFMDRFLSTVAAGIGLAAAIALGRVSASLLYQMAGYDPAVLLGALFALSVVAMGAGMVPAYRASRVEPTRALRYE